MEEVFEIPPDHTFGYGGARKKALVQDWLESAQTDGRPCRNTPQSAVDTLRLIDVIYQSSKEGRRVDCEIGAPRHR
jgi:predicted dehydrogenase